MTEERTYSSGEKFALLMGILCSVVQIIGLFGILYGRSWDPKIYYGLYLLWGAAPLIKWGLYREFNLLEKNQLVTNLAAAAGIGLVLMGVVNLSLLPN